MNRLFSWITPQFAAAIATLLLLLSSFTVWAADGDRVAEKDGNQILLTQKPCGIPAIVEYVKMTAPPGEKHYDKSATFTPADGPKIDLCWCEHDGLVNLADADGNTATMHSEDFKPLTGV